MIVAMNPKAVSAANKKFYAKHPELKGQPLKPGQPNYDQLSKEWKSDYEDEAAKQKPPEQAITKWTEATPNTANGCSPNKAGKPKFDQSVPSSAPQKKVPCDFEKITIKCKHCGKADGSDREIADIQFWKGIPPLRDNNLKDVPPKAKRIFLDYLEVVTSHKKGYGGNDKVTFQVSGGPGFCGKYKHCLLQCQDSETKEMLAGTPKSGTQAQFELVCNPITLPAISWNGIAGLIAVYYDPSIRRRQYSVTATTCGFRTDNNYTKSMQAFQRHIFAYPMEKYRLEINLQPRMKKEVSSGELNYMNSDKSTMLDSTTVTKPGSKDETKSNLTYGPKGANYKSEQSYSDKTGTVSQTTKDNFNGPEKAGPVKFDEKATDSALKYSLKTIKFTRENGPDGGELGGLEQFEGILNAIENCKSGINAFAKMLQKFQPKYGWYFKWDYTLFAGSAKFEWGMKEHSDHTVYRSWDASLNFELFNGNMSINYGFEWGDKDSENKASAYLFFKANGVANVNAGGRADPDKPSGCTLYGGGGITLLSGTVGFNAEAGSAFKMEGSAASSLPGTVEVKSGDTTLLAVESSIKWTGIKGKMQVSILWNLFNWQDEHSFIDAPAEPIWKFTYPKEDEHMESQALPIPDPVA